MTRPWRLAPLAAAAAAVAVAIVPASASAQNGEETDPISGDIVVEDGLELRGMLGEEPFDVWANLLGLKPHGSEEVLQVYCIDIRTDIDFDAPYAEGEWTESGVANLEHVRWVLAHGYPNATAEDLLAESGADASEEWDAAATAKVAYAGTQAAVWHFTDGFELDGDEPVIGGTDAQNLAVSDVYEHLVANAGRMPDPSEYFVELDGLDEAEYQDGRFGPYTVRSNAGPVELTSEGGTLVDENGDEVTVRGDGERFHIVLDEGSEGITITGNATYDLPIGRVFLATTEESLSERATNPVHSGESQKLILAQPRESDVPAEWRFALDLPEGGEEESDAQPQLPVTGSKLTLAFAAGLALVIGGLTAGALARRRPSAEQTLR